MNYEDAVARCWLEVDLTALCENYQSAASMLGARVIPVLKANAYGMGAAEVAKALWDAGARLFAVATGDEAEQLIEAVDGIEVLTLGLVGPGGMRRLIARGMPMTLYSKAQGEALARAAADVGVPARVHAKIDTGLHRIGLEPQEAAPYLAKLCAGGRIELCGLFTHLAIHSAAADRAQLEKLCAVKGELAALGVAAPLTHALDSIGMARYPDAAMDAARVGAWLYGVCPKNAGARCRPVARFKARVTQLRRVAAGELIGYDDDHPLARDSLVASISAGYVDGTPRKGVNWAVEIRGARAPVIGIACMDQLMADVTQIDGVREGDEVCFVGGGIDIEAYAEMGGFNHNEAWARIGRRVPRIYYEKGTPVRVRAEI